MITYLIKYTRQALEDISKLGQKEARIITQTINKKLKINPELYGKPLRSELKNFRSLVV